MITAIIAEVAEYLFETRHKDHTESWDGLFQRWPAILPDELRAAIDIYSARAFEIQRNSTVDLINMRPDYVPVPGVTISNEELLEQLALLQARMGVKPNN